MTVSWSVLVLGYLIIGCIVATVIDALIGVREGRWHLVVRAGIVLVVALGWLPLLVVVAVALALCLLALGVQR